MEMIGTVVDGKRIFFSIQGEFALGNPIGHSATNCGQNKALLKSNNHQWFDGLLPHRVNVPFLSGTINETNLCAIIGYGYFAPILVGKNV